MRVCHNCLNLQQVEMRSFSNGVHVLGGGSALAGRVIVWLVANHGFDGDVQTLFIKLPVERKKNGNTGWKPILYLVSPSSGELPSIIYFLVKLQFVESSGI